MQDTNLNLYSWLTLIAIVLGPILAVQIEVQLGKRRTNRQRKEWIYHTLIANRGRPLSGEYVQALNLIDIAFPSGSSKEKAVREAWHTLHQHFSLPKESRASETWFPKIKDLEVALIKQMGKVLKSEFEESWIRDGHYIPQGMGDADTEWESVRKSLVQLLSNGNPLPVRLDQGDLSEEELSLQKKMYEDFWKGQTPLKVIVMPNESNQNPDNTIA